MARQPQAAHNRPGQLAGQVDIHVSHTGLGQIPLLGTALEGIAFSRFYTSPLQRCKIPADFLRAKLKIPSNTVVPDLSEINYGLWAGKVLKAEFGGDESIEKTDPEGFRTFMRARHRWQVEGSETFWDLKRRATNAINQVVLENWGKVVLLITHGWVHNMVCANAFGIHLAHLHEFPLVPSAGLTVIEYSASQRDNRLWLWGNADHLPEEERVAKGYG
jgi:probable phosphoglycerate mutase